MAQSKESILISLEAVDNGLSVTFGKLNKSIGAMADALERAKKQGKATIDAQKSGWQTIADANRKLAGTMTEIVQRLEKQQRAYEKTKLEAMKLTDEQKEELQLARQNLQIYNQQARMYQRMADIRNEARQFVQAELDLAKRLQSLESQRMQAASSEVSQRRAALQVAKEQQDAEVKRIAATQQVQGQSVWRKLATSMAMAGQAAAKASTAFGATTLGAAMLSKNFNASAAMGTTLTGKLGAVSTAAGLVGQVLTKTGATAQTTSGKWVKLGVTLGLLVAAIDKIVGAIRKLLGFVTRLGIALGKQLYNGAKIAVSALQKLLSFLVRVGTTAAKGVGGVLRLGRALMSTRKSAEGAGRSMGQVADAEGWHSRSLKGLVGNVVNVNRWINTLGSSVRQLGQALQNAGTTMSIFISYPAANALRGMWSAASDFDAMLIEIRKNSDLALDGVGYTLENIKKELLDIASFSPTTPADIGKIAADAARVGLPPQFIAPFTQVMDQLVVATNITADDATTAIGRITNLFYDMSEKGMMSGEQFIKTINGIGSAINELGQANPITESELVAAALRVAPAAKAMGMSVEDMLGFTASVAGASASAERSGTQLARALDEVAANVEDLAKAGGVTIDTYRELYSEDPTALFLSIADAIASIEDPMLRSNAANELFGKIGGKATRIVGAGFEKVAENIALSRTAFEDGTSLMIEYSRAMDGVSNQVKLAKNQFSILSITLGEAFLPIITETLSYIIPLTQAFTKLMKGMEDRFKIMIVVVLGLSAVLGPLLYLMGSLLFSFGIMTTGMTGLITVFGKLISLPLSFAGAILGMLSPIRLVVFGIGAAAIAFINFGTTVGAVGTAIASFAESLYVWGYNAFIGFANGINAAAGAVYNAVYGLLEGMARMLEAFSPPKEGPLKQIDKWGKNLGETFVDSFAEADTSAVEEFADDVGEKFGDSIAKSTGGKKKKKVVASLFKFTQFISQQLQDAIRGISSESMDLFDDISGIYTSIAKTVTDSMGLGTEEAAQRGRDALGQLVYYMKSVQDGAISAGDGIWALTKYLGEFSADFTNLVVLQERYNEAALTVERIRNEMEGFDDVVNNQIKLIAQRRDMTISERVAAIRSAKISAAARKVELQAEEKSATAKQDALATEIEYRKKMISLLQQFVPSAAAAKTDTMSGGTSTKDKVAKVDDAITGLEFDTEKAATTIDEATDKISEKFAVMAADTGRFVQKMSESGEKLKGFFAGLFGVELEAPVDKLGRGSLLTGAGKGIAGGALEKGSAQSDAYMSGYGGGQNIRSSYLAFLDEVTAKWETMITVAERLAQVASIFMMGAKVGSGQQVDPGGTVTATETLVDSDLASVVYGIGVAFGQAGVAIGVFVGWLQKLFYDDPEQQAKGLFGALQEQIALFSENFMAIFGPDNPIIKNAELLAFPLASIAGALSTIAGLAFDHIGDLGTALGGIAKLAIQLWGVAGALASMALSFLGVQEAPMLLYANLQLIGDENLKDKINEAAALGNPSDPIGKQIVDYIGTSIQEADWSKIGQDLATAINGVLFGKQLDVGNGIAVDEPGLLDRLPLDKVGQIFGSLLELIEGFISGLELGRFGERIAALVNVLTPEIEEKELKPVAENIFKALAEALAALEYKDIIGAVQAIINAIVFGMYQGVASGEFKGALASFANALVMGVAGLDWGTAVATLGELLRAILGALADAPWGSVSDALTGFLNALIKELAKPGLWSSVGKLLGDIATAIATGIIDANWGALFNADTMTKIARAFIDGFYGGIMNVITGRETGLNQQEILDKYEVGSVGELKPIAESAAQIVLDETQDKKARAEALATVQQTSGVLLGNDVTPSPNIRKVLELTQEQTDTLNMYSTDAQKANEANKRLAAEQLQKNIDATKQVVTKDLPNALQIDKMQRGGNTLGVWVDNASDFIDQIRPPAGPFEEIGIGDVAPPGPFGPLWPPSEWVNPMEGVSFFGGPAEKSMPDFGLGEPSFDFYGQDISEFNEQSTSFIEQKKSEVMGFLDAINPLGWIFPKSAEAADREADAQSQLTDTMVQLQAKTDLYNKGLIGVNPYLVYATKNSFATSDTLQSVGENLTQIGNVASGYNDKASTIIPELESVLSGGASLPDGTGASIGATLGMSIFNGMGEYMSGDGQTLLGVIGTSLLTWVGANLTLLDGTGQLVGMAILGGMGVYVTGHVNAYDVITSSLSEFVGGITGDHQILSDSERIGEKISKAIRAGVENNWKEITNGIEHAVSKAIANVSVDTTTTDDGPPLTDSGSVTGTSTLTDAVNSAVANYGMGSDDMFAAMDRLGAAMDTGSTTTINVDISGVTVDSKKRIDDLADAVSRKLAKDLRYAGAR